MAVLQTKTQVFNLTQGQIAPVQRYAVETKTIWSGAWVRQKYIKLLRSNDIAAPAIAEADFMYHYSPTIKREDRTTFSSYPELDLTDQYIRILAQNKYATWETFVGVVAASSQEPLGGTRGSGNQAFKAYGILAELHRDVIRTAKAASGAGAVIDIDNVPTINQRYEAGVGVRGNRSSSTHSDGAYYFSSDGNEWTHRDLVNLLIRRYTPRNGPTFRLGGQDSVLDQFTSIVEIEGRTPFEILCEIINRKRALGFMPLHDTVTNTVTLWVYTLVDKAVRIGDVEIPPNAMTSLINLDGSIDIESPSISKSVHARFDEIEVRGAPIVSCFTIGGIDGTQSGRWHSTLENSYISGVGSDANVNDDYRKDDAFEEIYGKFGLSASWNGQAGNGEGGGQQNALPICSDTGEINLGTIGPFYPLGKFFENWLPFEEGLDYSTSPATNYQPSGTQPSYRQPFALIQDPTTAGKWYFVDNPSETYPGTAAHFSLYPREMAYKIKAFPRHVFGKGTFDAGSPGASNTTPTFDYRKLLATVAMRTDSCVRVVVKRPGYSPANDRRRSKLIYVADAEVWYVVPGTVLGINGDGTLKRYAGSGLVRDDRAKLRQIAAAAGAWYSKERRTLTLPMKRIERLAPIGSMVISAVTGTVTRQIGTCVTSLTYDYVDRRTMLQTEHAEIDFSAIAGGSRRGSRESMSGRRFVPRGFAKRGFNKVR